MSGRHDENGSTVCAHCGADIDATEWHPVITRTANAYHIYDFCDEQCRDAWLDG